MNSNKIIKYGTIAFGWGTILGHSWIVNHFGEFVGNLTYILVGAIVIYSLYSRWLEVKVEKRAELAQAKQHLKNAVNDIKKGDLW